MSTITGGNGDYNPSDEREHDDFLDLPDHVLKVFERFDIVREEGDGWLARCPSPDHGTDGHDSSPSLRLSLDENGSVLFCCRVGCTQEAVLEATGLRWKGLFGRDDQESGGGPCRPRRAWGRG